MVKELKNTDNRHTNKDFKLSLIFYIRNYQRPPKPKEVNRSYQNIQYHLKTLKKEGIAYKVGYGTWELDEDKAKQYEAKQELKKKPMVGKRRAKILSSSRKSKKKNIRGHAFQYTLKIPDIPGWHKREEYLKKKGIHYETIGNKNYKAQRILIKGHKTQLYNNSIVFYTPEGKSYYARSSKEAKKEALYDLHRLIKRLENKLKVSLKKNDNYYFSISRQHYGKVDDELAREVHRDGKEIRCYKDGKLWCLTDKSINSNETETQGKTADIDMDKVIVPFLNDLKEHRDNTGETLKVSDILHITNKIANNQQVYAQNIETHLDVLSGIKEAVKELKEEIKRINPLQELKRKINNKEDIHEYEDLIKSELDQEQKEELSDWYHNKYSL